MYYRDKPKKKPCAIARTGLTELDINAYQARATENPNTGPIMAFKWQINLVLFLSNSRCLYTLRQDCIQTNVLQHCDRSLATCRSGGREFQPVTALSQKLAAVVLTNMQIWFNKLKMMEPLTERGKDYSGKRFALRLRSELYWINLSTTLVLYVLWYIVSWFNKREKWNNKATLVKITLWFSF